MKLSNKQILSEIEEEDSMVTHISFSMQAVQFPSADIGYTVQTTRASTRGATPRPGRCMPPMSAPATLPTHRGWRLTAART